MAQKIHPYAYRLGEIFDWKSRWFNLKKYKEYLKQDIKLREFLLSKLERKAGVEDIEIERTMNTVRIIIKTSKPGMIIGRGGGGVEDLKKEITRYLSKFLKDKKLKFRISLDIKEVPRIDASAKLVALNIADQIEKRMPFRRVIKQMLTKVAANKDVKGVKIAVSGRLNGAEIARREWLAELTKNKIPLQTIRANIDYGQTTAYCTYGAIGVKVWIYKGEVFK